MLTERQVSDFFTTYQESLAHNNFDALSRLYHESFLFAGPAAALAVKRAEFVAALPKRQAYFSRLGLAGASVERIETSPMDARYLSVRVSWVMRFTDSARQPLLVFATYILKDEGSQPVIVFQLDHQDLAAVVGA
jgi:hypothetical protein